VPRFLIFIFTPVDEQLGLRLESARSSVDTIVIDHIESPPQTLKPGLVARALVFEEKLF